MALDGSHEGLLDGRHAPGCDGQEYSACRPVMKDDPRRSPEIVVVLMVWCGDCSAADYEVV